MGTAFGGMGGMGSSGGDEDARPSLSDLSCKFFYFFGSLVRVFSMLHH